MLRTHKKNDSILNVSNLNSTVLSCETTAQTMERQIDNYTRKLEQDKRKFFRAQQNFSEIKKQYDTKNKELEQLKSKKHKTQMIALKGRISTLQANLDQTINSYNESLAKNNKLKLQIDELRKDKKNGSEKVKFLTEKITSISQLMEEKRFQIQNRKSHIQKMKQQIINVKQINQNQAKLHQSQVTTLRKTFEMTGKENERKQKEEKGVKTQTIDTQPLVKLRLRNLLNQNKQKIKIIDQYKKSMHLIYQNFEEIKQQSGIQNLQEITKTFLKHEEQNLFIYQYMNRLNNTIEQLKETNEQVKKKIQSQQQGNRQKRQFLSGTPEEQKRKRDFEAFKQAKSQKITEMSTFLNDIKPNIVKVFKSYGLISQNEDIQLTYNNIQNYMSELQTLLNNSNISLPDVVHKTDFKQDATRYTKPVPTITQEPTGSVAKAEEKLLQKEKLLDIASQYWEKKKGNGKMTASKGNQNYQ